MSFTEIKNKKRGQKLVTRVCGFVDAQKSVRVSFADDLYVLMGAPEFVRVMVGDGGDVGYIALSPENQKSDATRKVGAWGTRTTTKAIAVHADAIGLSGVKTKTVTLPHQFDDGSLIIDIRPLIAAQNGERNVTQFP